MMTAMTRIPTMTKRDLFFFWIQGYFELKDQHGIEFYICVQKHMDLVLADPAISAEDKQRIETVRREMLQGGMDRLEAEVQKEFVHVIDPTFKVPPAQDPAHPIMDQTTDLSASKVQFRC